MLKRCLEQWSLAWQPFCLVSPPPSHLPPGNEFSSYTCLTHSRFKLITALTMFQCCLNRTVYREPTSVTSASIMVLQQKRGVSARCHSSITANEGWSQWITATTPVESRVILLGNRCSIVTFTTEDKCQMWAGIYRGFLSRVKGIFKWRYIAAGIHHILCLTIAKSIFTNTLKSQLSM